MELTEKKGKVNQELVASLFFALAIYLVAGINLLGGLILLGSFFLILSYSKRSSLLLYTYCFTVFFQNAFIAYAASFIEEKETFDILHGFNFLINLITFSLLAIRFGKFPKTDGKILGFSLATLVILTMFAIAGLHLYGLKNSLAYFRLFSVPLLMLWVGYFFAFFLHYTTFRKALWWLFILTLISIVGQFFFSKIFILLMNDVAYYGLKRDTVSAEEVVSYLYSNTYFNMPGLGKGMRAPGLIKSFISSAYFILLLSIILFWSTKKVWVFLIFIVVSICVASKGAILGFFFFLFYVTLTEKLKVNLTAAVFLFSFLWVIIVLVGLEVKNEHMLGFSAGLTYLDTFGNGLGFGGNLSDTLWYSFRGESLPDLGYFTRFQNGSESALGVLFSSLGVFSFIYIFTVLYIIYALYLRFKRTPFNYLSILCLVMFFQGIFQEEAYSPYAFGFAMFIAGFYYNKTPNDKELQN